MAVAAITPAIPEMSLSRLSSSLKANHAHQTRQTSPALRKKCQSVPSRTTVSKAG
jgi:hypothetical protein